MIQMIDVSKVYRIGGEEVRALDGLNMAVESGEYVSVIGPSGSGKSTLMNIIGCLDVVDSGQYLLDGQPIEQYTEQDLTRIRNQKIGFIFQNFNLLSKLTAEENIELPLIYQGLRPAERKKRVTAAIERVALSDRSQHKPMELSGGQQQRVAVARALVTNPTLLLADEPTGNLDSRTGQEIMRLFDDLHQSGNTIVLITHDAAVADRAKRCIRILDGKVVDEHGIAVG